MQCPAGWHLQAHRTVGFERHRAQDALDAVDDGQRQRGASEHLRLRLRVARLLGLAAERERGGVLLNHAQESGFPARDSPATPRTRHR